MIIYTGRFQPIHNGHLSLIKRLRTEYPNQTLCIAVIKDIPLEKKSEFDKTSDVILSQERNPFNTEMTLSLINKVVKAEGIDNIIVTLMPRASSATWGIIKALFDCERIWVFTKNRISIDDWEDKKSAFYQSMGDKVIRIPIDKAISGSDIRILIQNSDYDKLQLYLHPSTIEAIKNLR